MYFVRANVAFFSVIMVCNGNCVASVSRDSAIAQARVGISVRLETAGSSIALIFYSLDPTGQTFENAQFSAA